LGFSTSSPAISRSMCQPKSLLLRLHVKHVANPNTGAVEIWLRFKTVRLDAYLVVLSLSCEYYNGSSLCNQWHHWR